MKYHLGTCLEPNVLHEYLGVFDSVEAREVAKTQYTESGGTLDFIEWECAVDQYSR